MISRLTIISVTILLVMLFGTNVLIKTIEHFRIPATTQVSLLVMKGVIDPPYTRMVVDNMVLSSVTPIEYNVHFVVDGNVVAYRCSKMFYETVQPGMWFELELTNPFWGEAKILSVREQIL